MTLLVLRCVCSNRRWSTSSWPIWLPFNCFSMVQHAKGGFILYFHRYNSEVSWVIVYLETLASDAIAVWQHPYKCDALSFHNKVIGLAVIKCDKGCDCTFIFVCI